MCWGDVSPFSVLGGNQLAANPQLGSELQHDRAAPGMPETTWIMENHNFICLCGIPREKLLCALGCGVLPCSVEKTFILWNAWNPSTTGMMLSRKQRPAPGQSLLKRVVEVGLNLLSPRQTPLAIKENKNKKNVMARPAYRTLGFKVSAENTCME
ncbi:unnamed protein product [Natator depressus]